MRSGRPSGDFRSAGIGGRGRSLHGGQALGCRPVEVKQLETALRSARAALRAAERAANHAATVRDPQAQALSQDVVRAAERAVRLLTVLQSRHKPRPRGSLR